MADEQLPWRGVLSEVQAKRLNQNEKWGEQNHRNYEGKLSDYDTLVSICRELNDTQLSWETILQEEVNGALAEMDNDNRLRAELIQVAAVVVAWVECIDRRGKGKV